MTTTRKTIKATEIVSQYGYDQAPNLNFKFQGEELNRMRVTGTVTITDTQTKETCEFSGIEVDLLGLHSIWDETLNQIVNCGMVFCFMSLTQKEFRAELIKIKEFKDALNSKTNEAHKELIASKKLNWRL